MTKTEKTNAEKISARIKAVELEAHNAGSDQDRADAEKALRALWRQFARTGAGYTRKG